ncbi:hypothetical protein sos41_05460 [Alphaproteobacteria bacterium SO-S41]|nr:hypothetical protein sos41_05460 [Alphaproteobacteria bacterium SO-S41]
MNQATFGKRAAAPGAKPAAAPPRVTAPARAPAPLSPPGPAAPALMAETPATRYGGPLGDMIGQVINPPEAPIEKLWWSYFKACVTAFVTAVILMGLFLGSGEGHEDTSILGSLFSFDRLAIQVPAIVMMLTMAPALATPIRALADIMQKLNVPRGVSDMLIGAAPGMMMMTVDITSGRLPGPMNLCFLLGGAFGGFVFWRARGYPGLNRTGRQIAEFAHTAMQKGRDRL